MPLLSLHEVRFAYGAREVLSGVDLAVEAGELVAVVGPNGAGKSTLLAVASGRLRPTAGEVLLDGTRVHDLPRQMAARRIAGVGTEGDDAHFPFTVEDGVELGRHPWRGAFGGLSERDRERIDRALDETDLDALRSRPLPALSSGERQRARVARCLAQDGDLLLLDEPTAHLDLGHRVRVLDLFRRRAHDEGKGVLAALHDLNLAAGAADRVILLVAGEIVAEGVPAEVLTAEQVEAAFGAPAHVMSHPDTGAPVIVPREGGAL